MGVVSVPATLNEALAATANDHRHVTTAFTERTGLDWHALTPPQLGDRARLSVVIPACDAAYSLPQVLDALAEQRTGATVEVIAVDDASTDATTELLAAHPRVDRAVRLNSRSGAGAARNVGVHLAIGDTIVFLDADMVVRDHVLADIAARARHDTVLVGFRHNTPYLPDPDGYPVVPHGEPDLDADHRVRWTPPAGVPMFYTGQVYPKAFVGRPLQDTWEFIDLGHGRTYYDWDLPRMVVTALVAAPRHAVLDVGGFHPSFGAMGWGTEDTHLGAALISQGCLVIPLRQARGWHIDPPNPAAAWKTKLAGAAPRIALHRQLCEQPVPTGRAADLAERADKLLRKAVILR
ncbi:glycosyltransferase family 2 protein [Micromonospora aurantiaca (nom. illeg.)]|uniref:glycosyltransferase family 2 protein n=1 Tax=Micromonospora aurantiaca (nom. illeg.) TaxID=47850 RepID=UPI0038165913